jgi:ABC-type multidrug transport system ATPase subunit
MPAPAVAAAASETTTTTERRTSKVTTPRNKPASRRRHYGRRATDPVAPILQVTDLTVRAPGGAAILDEVSFSVRPGSLVAVVGPTGAGKTTLLNALTGRVAVDGGVVRFKGANVVGGDGVIRHHLGYVPQDDPLHSTLGLRRLLDYTAELRLGNTVDQLERSRRVAAVLEQLGLTDQAKLPIAFLSGGQKKRASVAVELISEPDVLVLDEPTTGLDPGREKSVLQMLRQVADSGRTVITVTHSTQALAACDVALFLAPGGRVAFFGPPAEAADYFQHADAADLFIDLGSGSGQDWKDRFRADPSYARHIHAIDDSEAVDVVAGVADRNTPRRQLLTLARRYVEVIRGDSKLVRLLAIEGPVLGFLLWAVLPGRGLHHVIANARHPRGVNPLGPASAVAMFLILGATWLGAAKAVREIVKEHNILLREEGSGLSLRSYVGSKVLVLGTLTIMQSVILTLLACARQSVGHGAVLGSGTVEIVAAVALSALAAVALGLVLSALVTTTDKAMTLLPMTLVAQLVLCGAWVHITAPGFRQLGNLTSAHWGIQAITATVKGDAHGWWSAMIALAGITAVNLVGVIALVQRRVRPAHLTKQTRAMPSLDGVVRSAIVVAAAAIVVIAGVAGTHAWSNGAPAAHQVAAPLTTKVSPPATAAVTPDTTPAVTAPTVPAANTAAAVAAKAKAKASHTSASTATAEAPPTVTLSVIPDPTPAATPAVTVPVSSGTATVASAPKTTSPAAQFMQAWMKYWTR